ncbi:MAG: MMPL family transporter [Deltaproteobacteria bacterium]|nr:MMPL family transporter [Deltaproteobacteria bacterium]MBW2131405.1 MMPL family transporter [Deltaproteobacteria bacterium]
MASRFAPGRLYQHGVESILYRPKATLLLLALITLFFAWQIPGLKIRTSIYDMVVENLPETRTYAAFRTLFGSDEIIRVVIKGKNVLYPKTFEKINRISTDLKAVLGVRRVISLPEIKAAVETGGAWDLERFAAVLSPIALFEKNLLSSDRHATAVTLVLHPDADEAAVIRSVEKYIAGAPEDLTLYQIGMPVVSDALTRYTQKDFYLLPPITLAVMTVILFFLYPTVRIMLIPLACVLIAMIWTFGLMAMLQVPLSMLTMIVPIFLIAVGTAYCLHITSEFNEGLNRFPSPTAAALATFSTMTLPTVVAVFTTVAALASLFVNRIQAIREFALFACTGILVLMVLALTFLPAAFALVPGRGGGRLKSTRAAQAAVRFCNWIAHVNIHRQRVSLPILGGVALFCIIGIFRVKVETNPVEFFKEDAPVSRHFHDIARHLSGSFPVHVSLSAKEEDAFEDPKMLKEIERVQRALETLPGVDKSVSFADYMKLVNYAINHFDPKYYALPEEGFEVRMLLNNYKIMFGEDMLYGFMSRDFSKANLMLLTHLSSSREFLEIQNRIHDLVKEYCPKTLTAEVTGIGMVVAASSDILTRGQVKSLSISMVLIFSLMFLLFLSFKVGLIAIVPNLFPIVVNFGIMGWLGIPLSAATSLIASIAIGLAVDDTIHYLVCFNREFKKCLDDETALAETLKKVGRSIVFTTVTISAGFSILMASNFKPTALFGFLMLITMASALVGDLLLLPSLMLHVELVTLWDLLRLKLGKDPQEGIPLFSNLSRSRIHHIFLAGSLKPFQSGEVIFRKGEQSDFMYAVISGGLDVVNPMADTMNGKYGGDIIISHIRVGDVVGEMGLFRNAPRSATVVAASEGELLQINWKMIRRLQFLYPNTAHKFFHNLVSILCDRLEHISQCYTADCFIDEESGVFNPRGFFEALHRQFHLAVRHQLPLSLCLAKIRFEGAAGSPNDFSAGERFMKIAGRIIVETIRRSDVVGRLDGQLFGLVLMGSSAAVSRETCLRIQTRFERKVREKEGIAAEMVFGVAGGRMNAENQEALLIDQARNALEKAETSEETVQWSS